MGSIIGLSLAIYGLVIVISLLVALLIKGIVIAFEHFARHKESAMPAKAPAMQAAGESPPIAAITAAVYAVIGPHRIVHIRHAGRERGWTAEGRSLHHTSHNIRHGRR